MRLRAASLCLLLIAPALLAEEDIRVGKRFKLRSEVLGEERQILLSTPDGYDGGGSFPVLYTTDGDAQFLHTVATVGFLTRSGRIPPLIVVGVSNIGGDRTRDLTQTRGALTLGPQDQPLPTSGGSDKFLLFFEKELIPHVEKTYRTLPYRIFAGHSFGGLFALHAFSSKPGLFGGVIAVSPTLSWDHDLPLKEVRQLLEGRKEMKSTLFVTMGNEGAELDKRLAELRKILGKGKVAGFTSGVMSFPDEDHGSVVLLSHYHGLLKVFEGWQMPRDPETGFPRGDLDAVRAHYARISDRYGIPVAPPEAIVNRAGYGELGAKRIAKALELFRFNVATYPKSANVYDSLGEGLEANGDLAGARDAYRKAVELVRKDDPAQPIFQRHLEDVEKKMK